MQPPAVPSCTFACDASSSKKSRDALRLSPRNEISMAPIIRPCSLLVLTLPLTCALLPSAALRPLRTSAAPNLAPPPWLLSAADDGASSAAPAGIVPRLRAAAVQVAEFTDKNYFLVGVVASVALAGVFPSFGRKGGILRPELTVAWGATCGIVCAAFSRKSPQKLRARACYY